MGRRQKGGDINPSDLDEIKDILAKSGYYILGIIGRGGFASIYEVEKIGDKKKYAVRITDLIRVHQSLDPEFDADLYEATNDLLLQRSINTKLSRTICDMFNKCETVCIDDHISCSKLIVLFTGKTGKYMVEVMEKYDSDLKKYISKHTFYELAMKDITYVENFNKTVKMLFKAIFALHKEGIAHGDIKPGNILINKKGEDKIAKLSLTDFDTLCFNQKCETSAFTPGYTTFEFTKAIKKNLPFDIDIQQRTDMYAAALVILDLWYGNDFGKEIEKLNVDNKGFPLNHIEDLSTNLHKRLFLLVSLLKFNKKRFDMLRKKRALTNNVNVAERYINIAIELFIKLLGGSTDIESLLKDVKENMERDISIPKWVSPKRKAHWKSAYPSTRLQSSKIN